MVNESTFQNVSRDKSLKNLSVKNIEIDNSYVTCDVVGAITGTVNLKITKVGDLVTVKILNGVTGPLASLNYISIVNVGTLLSGPLLPFIKTSPDHTSALLVNNSLPAARFNGYVSVAPQGEIVLKLSGAVNFTGNGGLPQQSFTFSL